MLNVRVGAGVDINRAVSDSLSRQTGKILLINYNSSACLGLHTKRWSQETVSEILISSEWSSAVRRNSYTSNSSCGNFKTLSVWYIIHNHLGCLSKMLGWFWAGNLWSTHWEICVMGQGHLSDAKRSQNSLTETPISKMWRCKLMLTNLRAALMWGHGWWSRNTSMSSLRSMKSLAHLAAFFSKGLVPSKITNS